VLELGRSAGAVSTVAPAASISTPDRRVRVFVSSTLEELARERQAARLAITALRQTPVMFETGARHHPPREVYRAYLTQSDVFVGVYWQRYGWVAPGEPVSGLEDEYLLSGDRPKLIYVKDAAEREPRLSDLLRRIHGDDRTAYKHFGTAEELTELVADDLAVLLTERFTASRAAGPPGLRPPRLPVPPDPILGRRSELATASRLLDDPTVRLVTLVGPGGVGKTRLALELAGAVAATATNHLLDGVWFVDLTSTTDPHLMLRTVAAALGIQPETSSSVVDLMADRLAGRHVLLVLDNFEQIESAAPDLAHLLAGCPGLVVLVTSRSVLGLRGERPVFVRPLALPGSDDLGGLAGVAASPAAQLLLARAQQIGATLMLTEANAPAVARLCALLDGLPLALELAAAQLRLLTPQMLLRRLEQRRDDILDLASGPVDLPVRQQTLRTTIAWSYSLLERREQELLNRLSIFVGTWTIEAAGSLGDADAPDLLTTLGSLVAQSLVLPAAGDTDEPRFRMFDTVRAYARERLHACGEYEATERRLAVFLRGLAAQAGMGLVRAGNHVWIDRIDGYLPDLLHVMSAAIDSDDATTAVGIGAPLFTYWWSHGRLKDMGELVARAAGLPSAARLDPYDGALLLWGHGVQLIAVGSWAAAEPLLRQLLDAATSLDEQRMRGHALAGLGACRADRDVVGARRLLAESVDCFRRQDEPWGLAFALSSAGLVALRDNDLLGATRLHAEALAIAVAIENAPLQGQLLNQLGMDAFLLGDVIDAYAKLAAAAGIHRRLLDEEGSAYCLVGLAAVALSQQRPETAAQLLGAAAHAWSVLDVAVWPALHELAANLNEGVAQALTPDRLTDCRAEGARMSTYEALGRAVTVTAPPADEGAAARYRPVDHRAGVSQAPSPPTRPAAQLGS
jgi:predicted ATPase